MAATIKDISKVTGLSVGTISRFLNGYKVKSKNEELITKAVDELDFKINGYARFLKTNNSRIIGIIIPSLVLTFSAKIVSVLEKIFSKYGYSVMITIIDGSDKMNNEKLKNLELYNLRGVVVIPPADNAGVLEWLKNSSKRLPIIVLDRVLNKFNECLYVIVDNEVASIKAVTHLIEKGHERIGFISGDVDGFTSKERKQGYIYALKKNRIPFDEALVINSDYSQEGGYNGTKALMALPEQPSALFITNYDMTIGALEYLKEIKYKIGKDISIFGFDMDGINVILETQLSMVIQPIDEMAEYTAEKLISAIEHDQLTEKTIQVFECEITYGDSVVKV